MYHTGATRVKSDGVTKQTAGERVKGADKTTRGVSRGLGVPLPLTSSPNEGLLCPAEIDETTSGDGRGG